MPPWAVSRGCGYGYTSPGLDAPVLRCVKRCLGHSRAPLSAPAPVAGRVRRSLRPFPPFWSGRPAAST
eukprot:9776163-Alexandrium_andersonii.AAC.1